jgi:anoctamin-10/anoctamin-7
MSAAFPSYVQIVTVVFMLTFFIGLLWFLLKVVSYAWTLILEKRRRRALENRRNTDDDFRISHGYSWDYMMAFKVFDADEVINEEQRRNNLRRILASLTSGGLEFRLFYNTMHNIVFVKIRASHQRLQKEASRIDLQLELDQDELSIECGKGRPKKGWKALQIPDTSDDSCLCLSDNLYKPYEKLYCEYMMDEHGIHTNKEMAPLYKKYRTSMLLPRHDLKARGAVALIRDANTGEIIDYMKDEDEDGSEAQVLQAQALALNEESEREQREKEREANSYVPSREEDEYEIDETSVLITGVESTTLAPEAPEAASNDLYKTSASGDTQRETGRRSGQFVVEQHRLSTRAKSGDNMNDAIIQEKVAVTDGTLVYDTMIDDKKYPNSKLVEYKSIFRGAHRIQLIDSIINNHSVGGCYLHPKELLTQECMLAYVPLHDEVALRELESKWVTLVQLPWYQCVADVKDYFGEKIGLYFAWLGHYTSWLSGAAIMGLIAWAFVQAEDGDPNSLFMPYFAGIMAIWATLYLEHFKRYQATTAMSWGMTDFEEREADRPEFRGIPTKHPVTGTPTFYYAHNRRLKKTMKAYTIIFFSLGVIIGALALMFFIRAIMTYNKGAAMYASVVTSTLTAFQIEVLNYYFSFIAIWLNDTENWRTDTEYEDGLISKAFVFQFVNAFSSLFYVAFMKPFYTGDQCNAKYCFYELQASLGALFMTRLFISNAIKLIVPAVTTRARADELAQIDAHAHGDAKGIVSEIEHMFIMPSYDALMGTFDDYSAMVAQFGYMTMFVSAFPLCTVLALVNNYVQMRVDAWRLCQLTRRPEPRQVTDIGMWYTVLELTGVLSVLTNAALISFTGQIVAMYTWPWRIWTFVLFTVFILVIKQVIAIVIPDTPHEVDIQLKRNEFVVNKVAENQKDYVETLDAMKLRVRPIFKLKIGDDDPL